MRSIAKHISLGLICMGGLSYFTANADPVTPFIYGHQLPSGSPNQPWMITPWTGSETEYVRAENTIDNEIENGFSLTQLESKYDIEAKQSPQNPVAQFARAYCYEKCTFKYIPIGESVKEDIYNNLERTDPHHIYEFTRERFIFTEMSEEQKGADLRYLDPLGRRLLDYNPNDFDVSLVLYETVSFRKKLLPESLKFAQEMVKKFPNEPRAYFALAEAESVAWSYNGDQAICENSILEYEVYLKMANPNDPVAKFVPFTVKAMQGYLSGQYRWQPPK